MAFIELALRRSKSVFVVAVICTIIAVLITFNLFPSRIFERRFYAGTRSETLVETRQNTTLEYCQYVLKALANGSWQLKPGITAQDQEKRALQDVLLRRHRGMPEKLTRSDNRCGTKYPISTSSAFGPSLPAMCDRNGSMYCCNASSWCSNGSCVCPECTDFRKIVSAELRDWIPHDKCQIRNYTSENACRLMNNKLSSLIIMGDSLMRHYYTALLMIFTDDPLEGTMIESLSQEQKKKCHGEKQFVDRGPAQCDNNLERNSHKLKKGKFCNGKQTFTFLLNGTYSLAYRKQSFAVVHEHLGRPDSLIVMGIGMHDGLDAAKIMSQFIEPMLKIIGDKKGPRLLWVTTHAQGYLKPMAYRGFQSNQQVERYDKEMVKLVGAKEIDVFDVFHITSGVHSYDGTHYGYGVNIAKAQFLLNYIETTFLPKP